jgi:hypothetical protein
LAIGHQLGRQLAEGLHLGAHQAQRGRDQARVAGGAAQPGQPGQDVELGLARRVARQAALGGHQGVAPQGLVVGLLGRVGLHLQHQLGPRRQVVQHLGLGAAQDEGRDQAAQLPARGLVALALDGAGKALVEARQRAQQAGVAGLHDRPQLAQPVLDGRARQRQAKARLQAEHRLGALGCRVLDGLGLVQHQRGPGRSAKASASGCSRA